MAENLAPKFDREFVSARHLLDLAEFKLPLSPPPAPPAETPPSSATLKSEERSPDTLPRPVKRPRGSNALLPPPPMPQPPLMGGFPLAGLRCFFTVRGYMAAEGKYRVFLEYHPGHIHPMCFRVANTEDVDEAYNAYMNAYEIAMAANADRGVVLRIPPRPIWI